MSQAVIEVVRAHCLDCGGGAARVVSVHYFDARTGPALRHIWLCASCEYRRDHPEALEAIKAPRSRSLRLQTERLFEV